MFCELSDFLFNCPVPKKDELVLDIRLPFLNSIICNDLRSMSFIKYSFVIFADDCLLISADIFMFLYTLKLKEHMEITL